jgi:hypothetical protein
VALRYGLLVAAITGAVGLALVLLRGRLGEAVVRGALVGAVLAAVAAIGAMALTAWSFAKSQRTFFSALTLGILARLGLFGGVFLAIAVRRPAGLDLNATAVALLGLYVVFQAIEVRLAVKRLAGRKG